MPVIMKAAFSENVVEVVEVNFDNWPIICDKIGSLESHDLCARFYTQPAEGGEPVMSEERGSHERIGIYYKKADVFYPQGSFAVFHLGGDFELISLDVFQKTVVVFSQAEVAHQR